MRMSTFSKDNSKSLYHSMLLGMILFKTKRKTEVRAWENIQPSISGISLLKMWCLPNRYSPNDHIGINKHEASQAVLMDEINS